MKMTSPMILTPQQWETVDRIKGAIWRGRKRGQTAGTVVNDLVALEKAITLCGSCQHKFDWRHRQYYSVWRYEHEPVIGACDACKTMITGNDGRLFLHENVRPQAWMTKDENFKARETMREVAITGRDKRR